MLLLLKFKVSVQFMLYCYCRSPVTAVQRDQEAFAKDTIRQIINSKIETNGWMRWMRWQQVSERLKNCISLENARKGRKEKPIGRFGNPNKKKCTQITFYIHVLFYTCYKTCQLKFNADGNFWYICCPLFDSVCMCCWHTNKFEIK